MVQQPSAVVVTDITDSTERNNQKSVTRTDRSSPSCTHNSWDNVRVIKGQVTLRCRECQSQWRTHVDAVWRKKKCMFFNTPEGCSSGKDCTKLHLHSRKESWQKRAGKHGSEVLVHVPADVANTPQVDETQSVAPTEGSSDCGSVSPSTRGKRPCSHNSWDNVRVKKGCVTLRCRQCQAQWRRALENLPRCPIFTQSSTCPHGDSCELLHLHTFKLSLSQRMDSHGSRVLHRIPPIIWMDQKTEPNLVTVHCNGMPTNWQTSPMACGAPVWSDSPQYFSRIPSHLVGTSFVHIPVRDISPGTSLSVVVSHDADVYLFHDIGPNCDGGFPQTLGYGWRPEREGPAYMMPGQSIWSEMMMHSTVVSGESQLVIPTTIDRASMGIVIKFRMSSSLTPSSSEVALSSECISNPSTIDVSEEFEVPSTPTSSRLSHTCSQRSSTPPRSRSDRRFIYSDSSHRRNASCPPVYNDSVC